MRSSLLARCDRGAIAVEHVVVIALVALASAAAWTLLGAAVQDKVRCASRAISEGGAPCAVGLPQAAAGARASLRAHFAELAAGGDRISEESEIGAEDVAGFSVSLARREQRHEEDEGCDWWNVACHAVHGAEWVYDHAGLDTAVDFTAGAGSYLYRVGQGAVGALVGSVQGVYTIGKQIVTHPIGSVRALGSAIAHPTKIWRLGGQIARAVWTDIEAAAHGDPEAIGRLGFDVAVTVATGGAGAASKAAGRLGQIARAIVSHIPGGGRLAEIGARGLRVVDDFVPGETEVARALRVGDLDALEKAYLYRLPDETVERVGLGHLRPLTGDHPLLFRGTDTLPDDAFASGLPVRTHGHVVEGSAEYASTTTNPRIARNFALRSEQGYVYVIRGRGAVDLRSALVHESDRAKLNLVTNERELAMHQIEARDIVGAYPIRFTWTTGPLESFIPNPRFVVEGLDAARGREIARALSTRTYGRVLRQYTDDVEQLYADAMRAEPELEEMTRSAASATHGEAVIPPLKSLERVIEKATGPDREVARVTDIARSRIVFDSTDEMYRAVDYFAQNHHVLRLQDRFRVPAPDGYRDVLLDVETPSGHIAEVQLTTRAVHELTEMGGHRIYEQVRAIRSAARGANRPLTAGESAQIDRLISELHVRYDDVVRAEAHPRVLIRPRPRVPPPVPALSP